VAAIDFPRLFLCRPHVRINQLRLQLGARVVNLITPDSDQGTGSHARAFFSRDGFSAAGLMQGSAVMTGARRVSANLMIFGLLYFAGVGVSLAAPDNSAKSHTASVSTRNHGRVLAEQHRLMMALASCFLATLSDRRGHGPVSNVKVKSRILNPEGRRTGSEHSLPQRDGHSQFSDAYAPSARSHLLHYPVWFQFCPLTNYREASANRPIVPILLTTL
jgi:hypothetical protein